MNTQQSSPNRREIAETSDRRPRAPWRLAAAALAGSLLVGCSPSGDEDTSESTGETTTAASSTGEAPTTTGESTTSAESSTGGTTGPDEVPLPPLESAVPLTDEVLRTPNHARDTDKLLDLRVPEERTMALADGYGDITLDPGEPVLPRTLDDSAPPAPGPAPELLVRFVHLADIQLADDESPARLANYDEIADGAFRPEEGHLCRMLNAAVRTINGVNVDRPLDFVLLGGDNVDNAQTNELEWLLGVLDGSSPVECDSAIDDDPVPGPDNDPKDPFAPVGLDVPWRWVSGNHDLLRQGSWPVAEYMKEPIGTTANGGTRDYGMPGSPIVTGTVAADPMRAFLSEADQLMRVAAAGDGHGIGDEALALGRAHYTFDVAGTPLRFLVISSAAATGAATGLIRQTDVDALIEPALTAAAAEGKIVIVTSHHRAARLGVGDEFGEGMVFPDALTPDQWIDYLGGHPEVILHLAAHSHTMTVEPHAPEGGHAYWEMASPALADFPHEMRLVEVWDQDNGYYTIRSIAFDFVADGDPLAEDGRSLGVADFTTSWTSDGRGSDPDQRNVELWIAKP